MIDLLSKIDPNDELRNEKVFLEFKNPEIKDLLKHFLTLISASLVFSITFSEKIINFTTANTIQKGVVILAWLLLLIAFGCCGIGLYTNYLAAEHAILKIWGDKKEVFVKYEKASYVFQDLSGIFFGIGLFLLVVAALIK